MIQAPTWPKARTLKERQTALLREGVEAITETLRARWSGWKSPHAGTSQKAWKTVVAGNKISIVNDATRNGQPYVQFVHRAGKTEPEVEVLQREVVEPATARLLKALEADLLDTLTPTLQGA